LRTQKDSKGQGRTAKDKESIFASNGLAFAADFLFFEKGCLGCFFEAKLKSFAG
jgi:hypothetical protein